MYHIWNLYNLSCGSIQMMSFQDRSPKKRCSKDTENSNTRALCRLQHPSPFQNGSALLLGSACRNVKYMEGFHKSGVYKNGTFIMENPHLKWMIWGYPYFRKPPYVYIYIYMRLIPPQPWHMTKRYKSNNPNPLAMLVCAHPSVHWLCK